MRIMTEVESYIRQAAIERGINPDVAVEVARREGGLKNPTQQSYVRKNGIREPSYGPFQMLVGGPGTGFSKGMGNSFISRYGKHPSDPAAWKQGVDFALDQARSSGWGAWYGAKAAGITGYKGIGQPGAVPQASRTDGIMQAVNPERSVPLPRERPAGLLSAEAYISPPVAETELPAFRDLLSGPRDVAIEKTGRLPQQGVTPKTSRLAAYDQIGVLGKSGRLPAQTAPQGLVEALNAQREQLASGVNPMSSFAELGTLEKTGRLPQSPSPLADLASQYASYGAGKAAPQQAGLLGEDVAYQRMINDLNAQKQQLQAGVDPMASIPNWTQQPQAQVQAPAVTQVQAPEMAAQPIAQQPAQQFTGGLLSPQEQEQFAAQRAMLSRQPTNKGKGGAGKKMAGAIGGGLLGGLMLGPLGGILGAALGQSAMGGRLNTMMTGYPTAPSRAGSVGNTGRISRSQLNESGRNAYNTSEQFRNAVDEGRVGLY